MHPRNPYKFLDLESLAHSFVDVENNFVADPAKGIKRRFDWSRPGAVHSITRSLLLRDFGIAWEMPSDRLCPPIPNRLNYILWVQDLLASWLPFAWSSVENDAADKPVDDTNIRGIDVGIGASAIYCLLGERFRIVVCRLRSPRRLC